MKSYKLFLEGGNIKIAGQGAEPIKITHKNRESVQNDVDTALRHIHDTFHAVHHEHLFGAGKAALKSGSAYSGSTRHLMDNKISHKEFAQHKGSVGDIDVQVPHEHLGNLSKHLKVGSKFGKYTVSGVTGHGSEHSALMKHESGATHQFDFEGVKYENQEPSKHESFLHSSDWEDTKKGIKGLHHKILLNAAGGEKYKFSITGGVKLRDNDKGEGIKDPTKVSQTLFGQKADHSKIHSFQGVADLVKNHIPKEQHQAVYDKFKASVGEKKRVDSSKALSHLGKVLGVKDINESTEEVHHTSVIPLVGFSPISHMGHAQDLGGALSKLPGKKHVGVSNKADLFSPEERHGIMKKQWGGMDAEIHSSDSAGKVITAAHDSLPTTGKKHLHILVGADRADFGHKLAANLKAGKIKEMEGKHFDQISVHFPEDQERKHGLSGTAMRKAASTGDKATFSKHLGPMFNDKETLNIMSKVKSGLDSGKIKVNR